jgi:hypothetical protein
MASPPVLPDLAQSSSADLICQSPQWRLPMPISAGP